MKTTDKIILLVIFVILMIQTPVSAASKDSVAMLPQKSPNKLIQTDSTASIWLYGDFLYMIDKNSLCVIDVSDPQNPVWLHSIPVPTNRSLSGIEIDGNHLFLYDQSCIYVYSLNAAGFPAFLYSYPVSNYAFVGNICDMVASNGIIYIAAGIDGVYVFDFTNGKELRYIGKITDVQGLYCRGGFASDFAFIGVSRENAVEVVDISDRTGIRRIHCLKTMGIPFTYRANEEEHCVFNILTKQPKEAIPELARENSDQKTAYLTIDDGPSRKNTLKNLDTLKKYGVKATFFALPKENMDDIYRRIIEEGHIIGNHSYVHDYNYLYGSVDNFKKDVLKAHTFLYERFQYTSSVFRFPGGTMGREKSKISERTEILHELGYRYFDWDVSTADTDPNLKKYGSEEIITNLLANNVIKGAKGKKKLIVLMHDSADKTYTTKALPKLIEGLQEQGYVFDVLTNY